MVISSTDDDRSVRSELVDVVDELDRVVATVERSAMRANRLRHRAVFVAVTDGAGRLLVHRRSLGKDVWPGWCDVAVGGVVGSGESYEMAARREVAEELGLSECHPRPIDAGRPRSFDDESVSLLGRCFQIVHPGPFHFADGEIVEAWWVDRDELGDLLRREPFLPDSRELLLPIVDW